MYVFELKSWVFLLVIRKAIEFCLNFMCIVHLFLVGRDLSMDYLVKDIGHLYAITFVEPLVDLLDLSLYFLELILTVHPDKFCLHELPGVLSHLNIWL